MINPDWFQLDKSRGFDDISLKLFMRASVLISEYLIYTPAILVLVRRLHHLESVDRWEAIVASVAILFQPSTLLIDHGHFQYNTVMLGFATATLSSILAGRVRWTCLSFAAALGFKQMALFYAPAVFAYLVGSCMFPETNLVRFLTIVLVTIISFATLFAPLIIGAMFDAYHSIPIKGYTTPSLLTGYSFEINPNNILSRPLVVLAQVVHRIFPFARGLFEDKVANFWCAVHTFHKLNTYPGSTVQGAALVATLASISLPCTIILLRPRKDLVLLTFATTAWGFFLFSFQVHEKNVLLPLLPMTLLLAGKGGLRQHTRIWVGFANILASWTLFPLLRRDGLQVPYYVLTLLWAYLLGLPPTSLSAYSTWKERESIWQISGLLHLPFYFAFIIWHLFDSMIPPPQDKPDFWIIVNVLIGAAGHGLCYLWCLWSLIQQSNILSKSLTTMVKTKTQ